MKFVHDLIEFEKIKDGMTTFGRYYETPKGKQYPSVTTVIGKADKSQGLIEWRKRIGEVEADKILYQAGQIGTAVHKIIEDYLNNDEDYLTEHQYSNIDLFKTLQPILDTRVNNIRAQEAALYSDFLKVGGRVDCIAEFDGKLSIIDFKTSRSPKKEEWIESYFMQAAAYAVMFEERTQIPITQLVILITGTYGSQIFIKHRDNYIKQFIKLRVRFEKDLLELQGET